MEEGQTLVSVPEQEWLELKAKVDLENHCSLVFEKILYFVQLLLDCALMHDASKFSEEELPFFARAIPKLADYTYGSDGYIEELRKMKPAVQHHYEVNEHHPEHFEDGIAGMDICDLIEMLCDWEAATARQKDGDIFKSLQINRNRFGIEPQLFSILTNTVKRVLGHADVDDVKYSKIYSKAADSKGF